MARTGRSFPSRPTTRRVRVGVPRTVFLEPGTSATFDFSLFFSTTSTAGLISSDTSNTNGQPRSIKCVGNSGGLLRNALAVTKDIFTANTPGRSSFFLTLGTYPDGGSVDGVFALGTSGLATLRVILAVDATGHLLLRDENTGIVGTGSTVLSLNTSYRIAVCWTWASATVNEVRVYINGVLEITNSNLSCNGSLVAALYGMWHWDCTSGAKSLWITDIYCDDSASLQDTGSIHVTAKRPLSNGSANGFTGSGTPSGYGTGNARYVNERPLNETNLVAVAASGSPVTEEYFTEAADEGDVNFLSKPLIGVVGWCDAKALASETAQIVVAGVSTPIALTSTTTRFMAGLIQGPSNVYPNFTIGVVTDTTVTTVTLYECGLIAAYISTISIQQGSGSFGAYGSLVGLAKAKEKAKGLLAGAGTIYGAPKVKEEAKGLFVGSAALVGLAKDKAEARGLLAGVGTVAGRAFIREEAHGVLLGSGTLTGLDRIVTKGAVAVLLAQGALIGRPITKSESAAAALYGVAVAYGLGRSKSEANGLLTAAGLLLGTDKVKTEAHGLLTESSVVVGRGLDKVVGSGLFNANGLVIGSADRTIVYGIGALLGNGMVTGRALVKIIGSSGVFLAGGLLTEAVRSTAAGVLIADSDLYGSGIVVVRAGGVLSSTGLVTGYGLGKVESEGQLFGLGVLRGSPSPLRTQGSGLFSGSSMAVLGGHTYVLGRGVFLGEGFFVGSPSTAMVLVCLPLRLVVETPLATALVTASGRTVLVTVSPGSSILVVGDVGDTSLIVVESGQTSLLVVPCD